MKLSELVSGGKVTTSSDDGYVHIIRPIGGGLFDSFAITAENFIATLIARVEAAESLIGVKRVDQEISVSFTITLPTASKIMSFDIVPISGTPELRIGLTSGGNELLSQIQATAVESISLGVVLNTTTVYVTRVSGTFDLITYYLPNWIG